MLEEEQDEYINVAQGCYAEILGSTPARIKGVVTFGMGTCTHVIVTNRATGYISLCHADVSTDLKDDRSGLPVWIRNACPDRNYGDIVIDIGRNAESMHYINQVIEVLQSFAIPLEKLTQDKDFANISIDREGEISEPNSLLDFESDVCKVTDIPNLLQGPLIREQLRHDRREEKRNEDYITNSNPPICIFNGSSAELRPIEEIKTQHSEIDWESLQRDSNTSSERERGSGSTVYSDNFHSDHSSEGSDAIHNHEVSGSNDSDSIPEDLNNGSRHLVRSEKGVLSKVKEGRQFIDLLTRDLKGKDQRILQDIKAGIESVSIPSDSGSRSVSNPFVKLIPEDNHRIDHQQNVINLSKMLNEGAVKSNTVICLERKEGGNNFGMKDVKLLAAILRYNDNNEQSLPIAKAIESSEIYQDAMLYNKAQVCGVEVIGVEGKNLQYNKDSPHYDQARESYMANRINQLTASGKNVILLIGSSHVSGLKKQLEGRILLSDKSKVAKDPKDIVTNIRGSLQKRSTSSFVKIDSVPQNQRNTKKTQRL
jgi:hypothetical protein